MTLPRLALVALAAGLLIPAGASLAEDPGAEANSNHAPKIAHQSWSFAPPFGTFDKAQLQRGFQIYKEVCSNCHSMRLLSYRNLGEPGGPQFSPKAVEVLASQVQVADGPNEKGEMFQRPARPSDHFRSPFANDQLARLANNGALPPDLSVIAKAREDGPDYIYALLTGYRQPPPGFEVAQGMHYNAAFPGHQIAMPPPLSDGVIAYTDGTKPSLDNYARDVSAYLMWAAEPKLEERHKTGTRVMIFLIVFVVIMYLAKRSVWAGLHHRGASHRA
jgi:cytochrome c1